MNDVQHLRNFESIGDEEVDYLLDLARRKSTAGRGALYDAISDLFERRSGELSDNERELMLAILKQLSHEVEMQVRKKLAVRLAASGVAPHELVVMLANDDSEVAYGILSESSVLRDADLIEIVHQRTMQHQLAVAIRKDISETVSGALVEAGHEDVIVTLLNNRDARISAATMAHLADESKRVDRYQVPLVRRPDLPATVARKMCAWVSAALRQHIVENFKIDAAALDDDIEGSMRDVIADSAQMAAAKTPAEELVERLSLVDDLSHAFVIQTLAQGQITLFEAALAKLTGLRSVLLKRFIYEPGGEGLAVACRAIDVEGIDFIAMYRLTRKARALLGDPSDDELRELSNFYRQTTRESAKKMLRRWLRDRDYLEALRALYG